MEMERRSESGLRGVLVWSSERHHLGRWAAPRRGRSGAQGGGAQSRDGGRCRVSLFTRDRLPAQRPGAREGISSTLDLAACLRHRHRTEPPRSAVQLVYILMHIMSSIDLIEGHTTATFCLRARWRI